MTFQDQSFTEPQAYADDHDQPPGFSMEDILWAIGIWSAILCLSPMIIFYLLMVA